MSIQCDAPIFLGDVGTILRLTVEECINDVATIVDVSAQTAMLYTFRKPDDDVSFTAVPIFTLDGIDGQIQYVTQAGELDQVGIWELQARITLPGGIFNTSIVTFEVEARLGV